MTDIADGLRCPLFPCMLEGDLLDLVNKQRADGADEIERLRDALQHYVSECDCNGGTYHEEDHITGKTLVKDCPKCELARAALGEGK